MTNCRKDPCLTGFTKLLAGVILAINYMGFAAQAETESLTEQQYLLVAKTLCITPNSTPEQLTNYQQTTDDIIVRELNIGTEINFTDQKNNLKFEIRTPAGRPPGYVLTANKKDGDNNKPTLRLVLSDNCELTRASRIIYENNSPLYAETLDPNLLPLNKEWINPPVPVDAGKTTGLKVALVDSGVNYTLPKIAKSLAVDKDGKLIGYDFWENDSTPYDAHPARSAFSIQRHGTRTASILLREAPDIALVPYRYPRPDMSRMQQLVEHAASHSIRIIGMPLGGNRYGEWKAFSEAASAHPEILFIASAGNNGRDIDINPVYPAGLDLTNLLVVTSSNDYVHPADRTNFGRISVDYLLPAEQLPALDYDGTETLVSGSSYAVSRLTALAARLLGTDPQMPVSELKALIKDYSVKANTGRHVAIGYLGDPLADTANIVSNADPDFAKKLRGRPSTTMNLFAVNVVSLDSRWTAERIERSLTQLNTIFAQCDIYASSSNVVRISAAEHVTDLSTGAALTLHNHLKQTFSDNAATIYFSNDTAMQEKYDAEAFGEANTRDRHWMKNSVWVTEATRDSGNALAHELFHVMINSGKHSEEKYNLMQDRTDLKNVELTTEQCQLAVATASEHGLLKK